jgi:hypothetical protein
MDMIVSRSEPGAAVAKVSLGTLIAAASDARRPVTKGEFPEIFYPGKMTLALYLYALIAILYIAIVMQCCRCKAAAL